MIAWFMIAIGTVAFFAYIAVSGVQTVDATSTVSGRAETVRRVNAVSEMLAARASALQSDGVIYAAAGVEASGEYLLPRDMQQAGATTWGARFQYCPMGAPLDTANGTVAYPGGSYGIRTAELNGKSYVVTGRLAGAAAGDPDVIGFVMAPITQNAATQGCGQITRSGENYTAPGYAVRAIRRSGVAEVDIARAAGGSNWYVSPTGSGDGRSWSTAASLNSALAAYGRSQGDTFRISLAEGSYSVEGGLLDQTRSTILPKKASSALVLIGSGSASISTRSSDNTVAGALYVPSDVEIRNVDFGTTYIYADRDRRLRITDSSVGPIVAMAKSQTTLLGNVAVRGRSGATGSITSMSGSSITTKDANLAIYYVSSIPAWRMESGSSVVLGQSNTTLQPIDSNAQNNQNNLFLVENSASLIIKQGSFTVNGPSNYPLWAFGSLTAHSTYFSYNAATFVGIQASGGTTSLNGIVVRGSSPPFYSISSVKSAAVVGYGDLYSSNRCWYRGESSAFRLSVPGTPSATSGVTANEDMPAMSPQPTALQVRDYQAAAARNAERYGARAAMSPTNGQFTCQQAAPINWTACSSENGYCNVGAFTTVRYGAGSSYYYRNVAGGITCDNATFGDPIVGTVKTCSVAS